MNQLRPHFHSFSVLFRQTVLTTNQCEKCTSNIGTGIQTNDISITFYESPPLTTSPKFEVVPTIGQAFQSTLQPFITSLQYTLLVRVYNPGFQYKYLVQVYSTSFQHKRLVQVFSTSLQYKLLAQAFNTSIQYKLIVKVYCTN